jgi:putative sterol carrier protein
MFNQIAETMPEIRRILCPAPCGQAESTASRNCLSATDDGDAMPVKFLSQEWAEEFNTRAAADAAAFKGKKATLRNVLPDAPGGEARWAIRFANNTATITIGDVADPEITMTQSYEVGAAINKGELDGQRAFLQGKVKFTGSMVKMVQLGGALTQVSKLLAAIDTEY